MGKWKLLVATSPWVVGVVALKITFRLGFHFPGTVDFGDVALVLTAGIFLVGFMLGGVMADFKESEKIPGEVACLLENLEDALDMALAGSKPADVIGHKQKLYGFSSTLLDWLFRKRTEAEVFAAFGPLNDVALAMQVASGPLSWRFLGEANNLRKQVTRIGVISRTGFLAAGRALLDTLVIAVIVVLLISRFHSVIVEYCIVSIVTLVYTYVPKLIDDMDDPFDYKSDGTQGSAEVELFPIHEYRERAKAKIDALRATSSASVPGEQASAGSVAK